MKNINDIDYPVWMHGFTPLERTAILRRMVEHGDTIETFPKVSECSWRHYRGCGKGFIAKLKERGWVYIPIMKHLTPRQKIDFKIAGRLEMIRKWKKRGEILANELKALEEERLKP